MRLFGEVRHALLALDDGEQADDAGEQFAHGDVAAGVMEIAFAQILEGEVDEEIDDPGVDRFPLPGGGETIVEDVVGEEEVGLEAIADVFCRCGPGCGRPRRSRDEDAVGRRDAGLIVVQYAGHGDVEEAPDDLGAGAVPGVVPFGDEFGQVVGGLDDFKERRRFVAQTGHDAARRGRGGFLCMAVRSAGPKEDAAGVDVLGVEGAGAGEVECHG